MTATIDRCPTTRPPLVTDEMLARFDERAPQYDRENRSSPRTSRSCGASGYLSRVAADRVRRRRAEPGRDQPAPAPHRLRRPGDRGRRQHAPLLRRAVRRPAPRRRPVRRLGARSRPPTATSSPPATARPATTSRCCSRRPRPSASTAAGRSPATRSSAACRRCGRTSASTPWTPATRPTRRSSTRFVAPRQRRATASRRRGTRSACGRRCRNDTILDRTFVPDEATILVCPAGFAGAGLFHVALFAWALLGFAGVYSAIARRAFDDTVASVHDRTSVALTRSMAYHPEVQHHVAEMRIHLEAIDRPPRPGVRRLGHRRRPRHGLAGRRSSPASTTS